MAEILKSYSALLPLSPRSDVSVVLQSIIDASPNAIDPSSREDLIKSILRDLKAISNGNGPKILTSKDAAQALLAIKTLGKNPSGSGCLSTPENLSVLLTMASAFKDDTEASSEALRCVANALLLIEKARSTFIQKEVDGGRITTSLLEKSSTPDQIFILSRILFLCTASGPPFIQTLVEEKHHGRTIVEIIGGKLDTLMVGILTGTRMAREAMSDLLKLTFNLLLHYPKMVDCEFQAAEATIDNEHKVLGDCWSPKLDGILPPLLHTFLSLPPAFPSPISPPLTHVIHSLIAIPIFPNLRPIWFGPNNVSSESASNSLKYPFNTPPTDVLQRAYDLLEVAFSHYFPGHIDPDDSEVREKIKQESPDGTLDDVLSPLIVLISRLCVADDVSRSRLRQWIVPDDLDRSSPLEARSDSLGRCLRLLGSVYHSRLKDAVGEMLFAMSDSNASILSALVGYGNVAGFLFHKGILSAPPPPTATSSSVTLSTPSGAPINPITGTTLEPKASLPEMSDEEKEREMEKLFVLFDRLERTGAIPPSQNPMRKVVQEAKFG